MTVSYASTRKRIMAAAAIFFLLSFAVSLFMFWEQYPSSEHKKPSFSGNPKPIFYKGKMLDIPAAGDKEGLKLPFSAAQKYIDPTMIYEESTQSVILTSPDKVIRMKTGELTALVNEKPFTLKSPVEKKDGQLYIPIETLADLTKMNARESLTSGAVILMTEGEEIHWGVTVRNDKKPDSTIPMREEPSIKAPILADVKQGEKVIVWEEQKDWYKVQLTEGYVGYIQKSKLVMDQTEAIPKKESKLFQAPWKPEGGKINLTWEQVTDKNPDTATIAPMPGLNVVSPTWFHLADGDGNLKNLADPAYVKWAHDQQLQIWALFSNNFDPKITTEALSSYDKRMKMTQQLLGFAQSYGLQGINLDFENVNVKDKANLVQFVREMTPLLHERGLMVSMDVTPKSNSAMWSLFYDRKALAQTVDYIMVMAYDEHWASSPAAGSVASLPWAEKSITQIITQDAVPPSKIILGVPFYTRIWTEEPKDGKTVVTSKAVFMETAAKIINEKQLTPVYQENVKQNYVEYQEEGKTQKIWLEDGRSMKSRIELVNKLNLAGVGSWRRGYELPEIWPVIKDTLEGK